MCCTYSSFLFFSSANKTLVTTVAAVTSAHISLSQCVWVGVCAKTLHGLAKRLGVYVLAGDLKSDSKRVCLAMEMPVMLLWGIRAALRSFSHHVSNTQNCPQIIHP